MSTVTKCIICEADNSSEDEKCWICGWPQSSIPICLGIEDVKEIVVKVRIYWFSIFQDELLVSRELREEIRNLRNKKL